MSDTGVFVIRFLLELLRPCWPRRPIGRAVRWRVQPLGARSPYTRLAAPATRFEPAALRNPISGSLGLPGAPQPHDASQP